MPSSSQPEEKPSERELPVGEQTAAAIDNEADDLDDLDDVLDEFSNPRASSSSASQPPKSQPPPPPTAASAAPAKQASAQNADGLDVDGLDDILSQNFAKELAQGMEALMKELGQASPGAAAAAAAGASAPASSSDPKDEAQFNEEELMKQFEAMMAGISGSGSGTDANSQAKAKGAGASTSSSHGPQQPANFNDALRATMARLKESDASATASSSSAADPFAALAGAGGDDMAKLLAALGGEGGEDGLDNPELAKMLEGMMDELMSKEILYEPLKELRDKYPAYLKGPESAQDSAEDRSRYEAQYKYVNDIVALFEDPKYDSKNAATTARIQDLMNQMQDCGSPPAPIVGDMPAELENIPGFGGENGECSIM